MESRNQEPKKAIDWKKKGLGWVPDYPEIRDYNLSDADTSNKLRLKTDENTALFEGIVEILKNLSRTDLNENDNDIFKVRIEQIENQISGNILFVKVKLHKLARDTYQSDIYSLDGSVQLTPNEIKISNESILSKQIIELKKYLFLFFLQHYDPNDPENKVRTPEITDDFDLTNEDTDILMQCIQQKKYNPIIKWSIDDEFGKLIKQLLGFFQEKCLEVLKLNNRNSKIFKKLKTDLESETGRLGIITYTILNRYHPSFIVKDEQNTNLTIQSEKAPIVKTLSIFSQLPQQVFEIIFNVLKDNLSSKIEDNVSSILKGETECLYDNMFKTLNQNIQDIWHIQKGDEKKQIAEILKTKQDSLRTSEIIQSLQNELYIIEPILSVITQKLYPLAQWKGMSIEEITNKGLKTFEKILDTDKKDEKNQKKLPDLEKIIFNQSVLKTIYYLETEIKNFNAKNKKEKEKEKEKLFFYFLLTIYLSNIFNPLPPPKGEEKEKSDNNLFDKKEFIQVEKIVNNTNNHVYQDTRILPCLDLYIPLSKKYFHSKVEDTSDTQNEKDTYLYFFLPSVIDLSFWFPQIKDQGKLNSCTAFAVTSLFEYFVNRTSNDKIELSPLFLYKVARNKMNVTGDVGASIRETMKALTLFGAAPEESWIYDEENVNEEPPAFCYAYAENFRSLKYFLLDYAGISKETLLFQIKSVLATGCPCVFGFTMYTSVYDEWNEAGHIPFPNQDRDKVVGGHTVVAVGYDDLKIIRCTDRKKYSTGAFLIRNSWGSNWGESGYGWLPYDYVLAGLTAAWWSLLKTEWFNESNFGLAAIGGPTGPTGLPGGTSQPQVK